MLKRVADAAKWHLRGLFATRANRAVGFAARSLWQPAEIEARRGLARELASHAPPPLPREVGYRLLASDELPDVSEVCKLGSAITERLDEGQIVGNKQFFRTRIAPDDHRLALIRLGLDPRMLALVSSYLGTLPVITDADWFYTKPSSGAWTKSQLWHCDDDAGDVVKIFVYCEDVTPDDGPFDLVTAQASQRAREGLGYRYAGPRYRVSDAEMAAQTDEEDLVSIVGPRGTAFVVDTVQCFHRGSRIVDPTRRRIAGMICYCPPVARTLPRRLAGGGAPMASFIPYFSSPLDRAVLGAPIATKWL